MPTRKTFVQPAPPSPGFLEATLTGYWQLPPPDWHPTEDEPEFDPSTEWKLEVRFLRFGSMSETANILASYSVGDRGEMKVNGLNIVRYLIRQCHPDDRHEFVRLVDDSRRVFTIDQASALVMWLIEESTGKASTTSAT